MDEDALIIERARNGSGAAFDELAAKYAREIYFLALRIVKNPEDAEEVTQQAFVNAWKGISGFRGGASFKTWLYRIAMNLANSTLRRRPANLELNEGAAGLETDAISPLDRIVRTETAREALEAIEELGEKQKKVVMLRIFQEMPYDEIGKIVGCSEETAKVHFHYGIENLRKKMKKK